MAQIKAYKLGDQIESLKQQVDSKYAYASDDKKALINAIRKSYENYLAADELSGRDAQRLWLDAYTRMNNILDDKEAYSPSSVETAYKNMFGRYSKGDIGAIGNKITRDTLESATEPGNYSTSATIETYTGPAHYNWNGTSGVDSSWYNSNTTNKQKALDYIDGLSARLLEAKAALSEKRIMHGITITPEEIDSYLQRLLALKGANWDSEDITSLNSQVEELKNISRKLKIQPEEFSMFFKPWYQTAEEEEEQAQTNPTSDLDKALREAGYEGLYDLNTYNPYVKSYLDQRGWHLTGKNGITYVIDDQGNLIKQGQHQIDTDSKSGTYKLGLFISPEGTFWSGDVLGNIDATNPFASTIALAVQAERDKTKNDFSYRFALDNDTLDDLIQAIRNLDIYKDKDFVYRDFSNRFLGDKKIIGINKNNPNTELTLNEFGYVVPDENTEFYYLDDNGVVLKATLDEMTNITGGYNYLGYSNEERNQIGVPIDIYRALEQNSLEAEGFDLNQDEAGRWLRGWIWGRTDIKKNPLRWFDWILDLLNNPNGTTETPTTGNKKANRTVLTNLGYYKNKKAFIENLWKFLKDNNDEVKITSQNKEKLINVIRLYNSYISSNKEGGILFAKLGNAVDVTGQLVIGKFKDPKTKEERRQEHINERIEAKGYESEDQVIANERTLHDKFKVNDAIRIGTIAADIASMVMAFIPGYGTAASAVTGAASTLTTFGLDIAEDGFQWSDVKNLGVNAAFDVAGLFGGVGKTGKIIKSLTKIAAPLLASWSLMLNGELYASIFKKLESGKRLNIEEWRALAAGLSAVAGMTRSGASAMHQRRIKNKLSIVNSNVDAKIPIKTKQGAVELTRELATNLSKATTRELAEAILKEADPKHREIKLDPIKEDWKLFKPKTWFNRPATTTNPLKDMEIPASTVGTYTNREMAEAYLKLQRYNRNSPGLSSDWLMYNSNTIWPHGVITSRYVNTPIARPHAPIVKVTPLTSASNTPSGTAPKSTPMRKEVNEPVSETPKNQATKKVKEEHKNPQLVIPFKKGGLLDIIVNPTPTWLKPLNI